MTTGGYVRRRARDVYRVASKWGIDPLKTHRTRKSLEWVRLDRDEYERQRIASSNWSDFPLGPPYPIATDRSATAGAASGHYFHQDLLVAREIFARQPRRHIDVGSRVDGFVAHVAAFRDVEVIDIRPLGSSVDGIRFLQHDVTKVDPSFSSITDSLSCLHALEHIGLGRYGDPVDYEGWRMGLAGLTAMVETGGVLYLGVPTGEPQRVEFNAHRVFSLPFLRDVLEERFDVERLAFVGDDGDLVSDVDPHEPAAARSFGAGYGCSIWVLRKR